MGFRTRDFIASAAALLLSHILHNYDHGSESLTVTVDLSFYTEYANRYTSRNPPHLDGRAFPISIAKPVPFDVDGDGIIETIVVPSLIVDGETENESENKNEGPTREHRNDDEDERWVLKVLDLKPLHRDIKEKPIYPDVIFQSKTTETSKTSEILSVPIKITTGQIILVPNNAATTVTKNKSSINEEKEEIQIIGDHGRIHPNKQKRHYFCGHDWNDATNKCSIHTHCQSGSHDDCPDGEQCFGNIPCDILELRLLSTETATSTTRNSNKSSTSKGGNHGMNMNHLVTTPVGGLPSIVTVWNNGDITLHSVTATISADTSTDFKKIKGTQLELREMWKVNPFIATTASADTNDAAANVSDHKKYNVLTFEEIDVVLDSHVMMGTSDAVVIVAAKYHRFTSSQHQKKEKQQDEKMFLYTSYFSIDAFTGEIIWINSSDDGDNDRKDKNLEQIGEENNETIKNDPSSLKRISSTARRRSRISLSEEKKSKMNSSLGDVASNDSANDIGDCLTTFRESIMNPYSNVLPLSFHDSNDSKIILTHFDRRMHKSKKKQQKGGMKMKKTRFFSNLSLFDKERKATTSGAPTTPLQHHERSNVVLFHNHEGMNVFSLRNGSPVCHTPLRPGGVYADLNKDGVIDHLRVFTDNTSQRNNALKPTQKRHTFSRNQFVDENMVAMKDFPPQSDDHPLCHATLLSGILARDELFRIYLCAGLTKNYKRKKGTDRLEQLKQIGVSSGPPLLVESFSTKNGKSREDIIFFLNHGSIQRYDASGELQWSRNRPSENIPRWDSESIESNGFLGRINFQQLSNQIANIRPILCMGNDEMIIMSSGGGRILANVPFPQLVVGPPILADIDGDGTTDILVMTKDAIWGYSVKIIGRSFLIRISIAILVIGFLVAIIFATISHGFERATDAG